MQKYIINNPYFNIVVVEIYTKYNFNLLFLANQDNSFKLSLRTALRCPIAETKIDYLYSDIFQIYRDIDEAFMYYKHCPQNIQQLFRNITVTNIDLIKEIVIRLKGM